MHSTMKTTDTEALRRELNQARSKPDAVNRPVRTARTFVHHYNSTQYCSTETVLLIFSFGHTNITSQMWPSGGKGGWVALSTNVWTARSRLSQSRGKSKNQMPWLLVDTLIMTAASLTPPVKTQATTGREPGLLGVNPLIHGCSLTLHL